MSKVQGPITWADGYGRWYAAVSPSLKAPARAALKAIRSELQLRNDIGSGYRLRVVKLSDQRDDNRIVYRERS